MLGVAGPTGPVTFCALHMCVGTFAILYNVTNTELVYIIYRYSSKVLTVILSESNCVQVYFMATVSGLLSPCDSGYRVCYLNF